MAKLKLPELDFQTPTCGNCEAEVGMDGPNCFYCESCGVFWSGKSLTPKYDYFASRETCNVEIKTTHPRYRFMMTYHEEKGAFRPCPLPKGHESKHYFVFEPTS